MHPTTLACVAGGTALAIAAFVRYRNRRKPAWSSGAKALHNAALALLVLAIILGLYGLARADTRPPPALVAINTFENHADPKRTCTEIAWAKARALHKLGIPSQAVGVTVAGYTQGHTVLKVWTDTGIWWADSFIENTPVPWSILAHDGYKPQEPTRDGRPVQQNPDARASGRPSADGGR